MPTPRALDRVKETVTVIGTGAYTVGATPAVGYRSITSLSTTETAFYACDDGVGGYEVGIGTYTSPDQFARTTILRSSNSDLAVSWAAGNKTLALVAVADYAQMLQMKHNFAASAAPAVTDDTADGYHPGSLWYNITGRRVYVCISDGAGAAVWQELHSSVRLAVEQAITTPATLSGSALLAVGASATASAVGAVALGSSASATAADAYAFGTDSVANAVRAVALGHSAYAAKYGAVALGYAGYSTFVNAVTNSADNGTDVYVSGGWLLLAIKTTDATPTYLQAKLDQATYGELALTFGEQSFAYSGLIAARSAANTKVWKVEGAVKRDLAGNITLVGTPSMVAVIAEDTGAATWTLTVSVNTGTQALRFDVTGQAATNIAWGGKIMFTQLEYYE